MLNEVRFASQPGQVEYAMTQSRLACLKGRSQFPTPRRHADQRPDIQSFGRLLDLPLSGRLHYPAGFGGRRKTIFCPRRCAHRRLCLCSAFPGKPVFLPGWIRPGFGDFGGWSEKCRDRKRSRAGEVRRSRDGGEPRGDWLRQSPWDSPPTSRRFASIHFPALRGKSRLAACRMTTLSRCLANRDSRHKAENDSLRGARAG